MAGAALPGSLVHLFLEWASRSPHAPAVVSAQHIATYRQLERASRRAALAFAAAGWRQGQVVGVALGDLPPFLQAVTVLGLARAHLTQVLIGPREASTPEGAAILRFHRAVGMVAADMRQVPAQLTGVAPDAAWMDETGAALPELTAVPADLPWTLGRTSGTTGAPKSFAITHRQEAARMVLHAPELQMRPDDRVVTLTGLAYLTGVSCALRAFASGAALIGLPPGAPVGVVMQGMHFHGVTHVWASPVHLQVMLAVAEDMAEHLPRLRVLRIGGSALAPALLERARQRLSARIYTSYGTNEAGGLTAATPAMLARRPETVGRFFAGIEVELRDEHGAAIPSGRSGRVWVRSPANVAGYLQASPEEAARFRDGWFDTGDIATIDQDGLVVLRGRADEMMNFDGILISPREIEIAFEGHRMVKEAAAFALRSTVRQQLPCLAVVPADGFDPELLFAHGFLRLGNRAPIGILTVAALPRNPAGKVLRRELAAQVAKRPEALIIPKSAAGTAPAP